MRELYDLIERETDFNIKVSCYMLELYNDQLVDLLGDKVRALHTAKERHIMMMIMMAIIVRHSVRISINNIYIYI